MYEELSVSPSSHGLARRSQAKRAALVILYVCMVMELFYLIIISHILVSRR